jgi:hypothetical protein
MDRRSVVARRRKSVRGEHLAGLSVVRVHLVSTLHISDTVAAVDRALTAWSGRVVVTLVEHPGGRAAAAPVPPPRRAHLLRRPGNRRRSTANATSPLARRATSSRSHRRNRARSGCPIRPRHSSPEPTSTVSKVICRRCRSNPHTIAIRDLLARVRTLGKPHGCPRTRRGGPHTLNVLGWVLAAPFLGSGARRPRLVRASGRLTPAGRRTPLAARGGRRPASRPPSRRS